MKKITKENWPDDWEKVPAWTMVDEEMYNRFLNSLPPVSFYPDHFQAGGVYSHEEDAWGRLHGLYMTFADCGKDGLYYLGLCQKEKYPEKDIEAIKKAREENGL